MKRLFYVLTACVFAINVPVSAVPPKISQPTGSSSAHPIQSSGTVGGGTGGAAAVSAPLKAQAMPFSVYSEQGAKTNHYIPSGWMGDYGDLKINPGATENPHGGKTCVKITYSAQMTNNAGWAGMYWQHPANNWATRQGGFNLSAAQRLTFWARGAAGGEKIAEFKCGGITGEYPDTDSASIGPVELTSRWKQYVIDLKGKDMSAIIGGFAWAASKDDNPDGFVFYLDDIVYE